MQAMHHIESRAHQRVLHSCLALAPEARTQRWLKVGGGVHGLGRRKDLLDVASREAPRGPVASALGAGGESASSFFEIALVVTFAEDNGRLHSLHEVRGRCGAAIM